jgi:hypothetical protein
MHTVHLHAMAKIFLSLQDSYVETLIPSIFGGGALGDN